MMVKPTPTFNKDNAISIEAQGSILPNRFVSYTGEHAGSVNAEGPIQSALPMVLGVSETAAAAGEMVSLVTGVSYLVEASQAIAFGDYVRPVADGRAGLGANLNHCGIALSASAAAGELIEVQLLTHLVAM